MNILLDTGPLVAYLDKRDQYHRWATQKYGHLSPPFTTCEAVISEVVFLLQRNHHPLQAFFEIIKRGDLLVKPVFHKNEDQRKIMETISNYSNLPADFADACLVRMGERERGARIFTLDSDFTIYRTSEGNPLSLISPWQ
jgi:predicted nucleic acid-binding protein